MNLTYGVFQVIIANIINLIISACNSFILPNYLSIEAYAELKTFLLYKTYVGILHFGFIDGVYITCGGRERKEIQKEYLYSKKILFFLEVTVTLVCFIIAKIVGSYILICVVFFIVPSNMVALYKMVCQAVGEFKKYRIVLNMTSLLLFSLNIFCLFGLKVYDAYWYIGTNIVTLIIVWFYCEWKDRNRGLSKEKFNTIAWIQGVTSYTKQGIVLMIGNFIGIWITEMDKWFVKILCSVQDFAYYSFAVSVAQLLNIVITAFSVTLYNYFCRIKEAAEICKLRRVILILGALMLIAMYPAEWLISHFIDKYNAAIEISTILFAVHYIMLLINAVYLNLYKSLNRQKKYMYRMLEILLCGFGLNICLYFLWEKSIMAIAVATLLTTVIWLIMCQYDLPQYKMAGREWLYILIVISIYFICQKFSPIAAAIVYTTVIIIISIMMFFNEIIRFFLKPTRRK